ncbi:MAG TPA: hypothetical protein VFF28_04715 [Candidatus Nanoarchaeia archaeon]|nr:hypothetical protein [Candidatus Nanoarchaeia archaeon]
MISPPSTLQVERETRVLIKQYCFIHKIQVKQFVEQMANERLAEFKKRLEELKKLNI